MTNIRTTAQTALPQALKISQGPTGRRVTYGCNASFSTVGADYTPLMQNFNATAVRMGSDFPGPANFVYGAVPGNTVSQDVNLASSLAAGFEIIWTCNGGRTVPLGQNQTGTQYSDYITALAIELTGKVGIFLPRNEPFGVTMNDAHVITAADMVAEGRVIYPAIKAGNPNALVCAFGDNYMGTSGPGRDKFLQLINAGWLDTCDGTDMHNYGGGLPETYFAKELAFLERAVHNRKPNHFLCASEFGWRLGSSTQAPGWNASGDNVATESGQAKFHTRMMLIYRCIPGMRVATVYKLQDDAGAYMGMYGAGTTPRLTVSWTFQTLAHLNTWYDGAAYVHGVAPQRVDWDSSWYYHGADLVPWHVRGTLQNEKQELAFWFPETFGSEGAVAFPRRIMVNNLGGAGTIKVQTIGGTTASSAVATGLQALDVVATDTPKFIYSDDAQVNLRFPEYSH